MDTFKVTIGGAEREKDEVGRFKCLECGEFKVKKKPGRPPNKYCAKCGKDIKTKNLNKGDTPAKGKQKIVETKISNEDKVFAYVGTPAGDSIPVKDENEKKFYEERRDDLLKNYDFSGAELDLLKTFLQLSLEEKRLERSSLIRSDPKFIKSLLQISETKVKVQQSLGITRDQRIERTEVETVEAAVEGIIQRFKKFRASNEDKFIWKCKKCGAKNIESRINPETLKDAASKEKSSVVTESTPTVGDKDGS